MSRLSALLLLAVLFTSWLYISLHTTKANKNRWPEARELTMRLRHEFLVLNVMFVSGIALAYYGMYAVMCTKVTHRGLSWAVQWEFVGSAVVAALLLFKVAWEIKMINHKVEKLRDRGASAIGEAGQAENEAEDERDMEELNRSRKSKNKVEPSNPQDEGKNMVTEDEVKSFRG